MAATHIKIDENEIEKTDNVHEKKLGAEKLKRSALGELGNRVILRPTKTASLKDSKETRQIILRNAKPRVDTHWKKPTQSTDNASAAITSKKIPTARNVSTRQMIATENSKALSVATTKTDNRLVTQTKIGTKSEPLAEIKEEQAILRREDSNLSQRSLRALKAAINNRNTHTHLTKQQNQVIHLKTTTSTRRAAQTDANNHQEIKVTETNNDNAEKYNLQIVSVQSHSMKLLSQVDDIDADDTDNPILVSEYVNDIYDYLFSLETQLSIRDDHLKNQEEVVPKMRAVLIDWINEVHFQFHLAPETFQMTVGIIDRYLQAVPNTKRQYLQLVGVTALFIAAKYEELYPPPIADYVYITDDTYTTKQILQMEMKIVKTLDFNLARPVPIHFLRRFSKAAKAEECHHSFAKYFLELVAVEYDFASVKPSETAAASLNLALKLLKGTTDDSVIWTPTLVFYSRYTADQLRPLVKKIATIVRNAPNAKLKAVYVKFQQKKFNSISASPELSGRIIDAIIEGKHQS